MAYGKGWRRGIAITFAFVLVTSVVIPAGAIGSGTVATAGNDTATAQPPTDSAAAGSNATSLPADAPPALQKYEAVRQTRNLSAGGKRGIQSNIDRAHDRFNTSLSYFTGPVRVNDSKAFTHDAVGIRALAHTVRTDNTSKARHIADLVYQADNATATATVADARQLLERYGDEMDNQGLRHSAEAHLDNGERALDRARSIPGDVDGRRYFGQRARAVTKLRLAHRQASLAIRFVDREIAPNVTIESTSDPVWDGSGNRTYVVRGNVSAVRPGTLGNITVTVNDARTVVARTDLRATTPGENGRYVARVNLTERVNRIEVSVIDRAPDGQNQPGQQDSAVLRLDGDGLPGSYETSHTESDPLDANSDSAATAADESTNETIDGREDFDADRLTTIDEFELGTDPLTADTDGDRLTDSQEAEIVRTDPLVADSDSAMTDANESANGVLDAAEDLDGDGLANVAEFDNGTSPLYNDTDADGLIDPEEIDLGTDPRSSDTDDDFLSDADELKPAFETDPLDPDTDDDGVVDGNESYTTVASNESMGVSVSLTGEGNVSASTRIAPPAHVRFNGEYGPADAAVGSFAYVSVDREFESASVTVDYNESALETNESSLGLYRFNETSGAYERLPTTIDAANDTMTGTTDHFSIIVPLDAGYAQQIVRQRSQLQRGGSGGSTTPTQTTEFDFETSSPVSIPSGSSATVNGVTWACSNDPRSQPHSDTPISGECVVENGNATVREETNRMRYLETEVTLPNVDSDEALFVNASVYAHIEAAWSNAGVRLIVDDDGNTITDVFRLEQDYGSGTKTLAATPRMDISEMAGETVTISFQADGRHTYRSSNTMSELFVDSLEIKAESGANVDSDGDGISDAWESGGIPLANTTRTVHLDPNDPDTDGDGWEDGEEVDIDTFHADQDLSDADVIHFPGFAWSSDPTVGDTDGDGLADKIERNGWDVPVVNRSNGNDPYRFDKQCERTGIKNGQIQWTNCEQPNDNITVDSSPLTPHSDLDFVSDYDEYNASYTDPRAIQTYNITSEHEAMIESLEEDNWIQFMMKANIPRPEPGTSVRLSDGSDDSDFVQPDTGNTPRDRIVYTALDGTQRTDMWHSNYAELVHETDPWDPDTDDDGLTDGQELHHLTSFGYHGLNTDPRYLYETDSLDADTDGDGYWDGWIGVFDVHRTENVVLYRENLRDDDNRDGNRTNDGLQGNEIVQEQIGYHEIEEAPSRLGADIDGDSDLEHSNLHLGERIWGTSPTDGSDGQTPTPGASIEVDYFAQANLSLDNTSWRERVETNYLIYGIDLDVRRGDVIDQNDLDRTWAPRQPMPIAPPFDQWELYRIESDFHDTETDYYIFATSVAGQDFGGGWQSGVYRWIGIPNVNVQRVIAVFTAGHTDDARVVQREFGLPGNESMRVSTAKTTVHEIGHLLDLGELDDRGDEVYSGDTSGNNRDYTIEQVIDRSQPGNPPVVEWSVMSGGNQADNYLPPSNASYTPFSIEEWLTMTRDRLGQ